MITCWDTTLAPPISFHITSVDSVRKVSFRDLRCFLVCAAAIASGIFQRCTIWESFLSIQRIHDWRSLVITFFRIVILAVSKARTESQSPVPPSDGVLRRISHLTLNFLLFPPQMNSLMVWWSNVFVVDLSPLTLDWCAIFAVSSVFATMV